MRGEYRTRLLPLPRRLRTRFDLHSPQRQKILRHSRRRNLPPFHLRHRRGYRAPENCRRSRQSGLRSVSRLHGSCPLDHRLPGARPYLSGAPTANDAHRGNRHGSSRIQRRRRVDIAGARRGLGGKRRQKPFGVGLGPPVRIRVRGLHDGRGPTRDEMGRPEMLLGARRGGRSLHLPDAGGSDGFGVRDGADRDPFDIRSFYIRADDSEERRIHGETDREDRGFRIVFAASSVLRVERVEDGCG